MEDSQVGPLDVAGLMRRFGLRPKKGLGQNFLVDESALRRVVAAAELEPGDAVLEIGPGLGSLTRYLARAARQVAAVELDGELLPALRYVLQPYSNVQIVHGDILTLYPLPFTLSPYKVVANIPYNITSAILRRLLEAGTRPTRMVLTMQREVAERICAGPGEMSLLAVSVQFYCVPRLAGHIPAGAFHPRPEVDSAILQLEVRPQPVVEAPDVDGFFRVVKAGFSQKRKQLRNSLAGGLGVSPAEAEARLLAAGLDPKRRAETLSLEEWGRLVKGKG